MKTLVIGAGGNGQTHFMNFLKENGIETNCSSDSEYIKHLPFPEKTTLERHNIARCIFLYNDPLLCILSHFKRKYQYVQIIKLGNKFNLNPEITVDLNTFFEIVAQKNEDIFGIKYQFDNWINSCLDIPILFLDFNDVLKQKVCLDKFLDKNLDYNLFNIKPRNSICEEKYDFVRKIYDELYEYIKTKAFEHNKKLFGNVFLS